MMDDVQAVAASLAKEADARRAELERERQVPPDLFRRAAEAGLFRQLICTELGGLGRSAVEWFRTGVEMARWEPSRRALDEATELVRAKIDRATNAPLIGNAHVQRQLMRAEAAWSAANAGVEQALIRLWEDAEQSRRLPIATRIALLTANVHASATAIEIIEAVCDIVGTSVAPTGAIFGACLRDARTLGSHTAVSGSKLELAARMRFGLLEESFLV